MKRLSYCVVVNEARCCWKIGGHDQMFMTSFTASRLLIAGNRIHCPSTARPADGPASSMYSATTELSNLGQRYNYILKI